MRGILLLGLGAGLIWLGLSTAPRSGASAGAQDGEDPGRALDDPDGDDSGTTDSDGGPAGSEGLVGPARPALSAEFGDPPGAAPAVGWGESPGAAERGSEGTPLMVSEFARNPVLEAGGDVDPNLGPVLGQDPTPGSKPVLEARQPGRGEDQWGTEFELEWNGGAAAYDPAAGQGAAGQGDETPSFHLGQPTSNPVGLAVLLLESWIAGDPTSLERRLNDTETPVPLERRRLVFCFWQGASSDPAIAAAEAEALREAQAGVTTAQLELLRAAGNAEPNRPVPATSGHRDPLARAMRMVLLDVRATRAGQRGDHPLAARSCSDLIQLELTAPWAPHRPTLLRWSQALNLAQAQHRLHRDGDWPALEHIVRPADSLSVIRLEFLRRQPHLLVCEGLLREVNDVGKYIHPGDLLRIPTEPPNVVVDLDARLAVYRHGSEAVMAWEVGIGKVGNETPPGIYAVGIKQTNPTHWVAGGEVPFGHPDNPLGTRWIEWVQDGRGTHLGFHGTKDPAGVGGRVSLGCIRMRNEDVEMLFGLLPRGSRIEVRL